MDAPRHAAAHPRVFLYPPEELSLYTTCDKNRLGGYKYGHSLYLVERMRRHAWRVANPRQADIAIVPILLEHFVRGLCQAHTWCTPTPWVHLPLGALLCADLVHHVWHRPLRRRARAEDPSLVAEAHALSAPRLRVA